MARWALLLGGLSVWAIHFLGAYALASVEDIEPGGPWRAAMLGLSAICLAAAAAVVILSARWSRGRSALQVDLFLGQVAAAGGGLAMLAIIWQTLPVLMSR